MHADEREARALGEDVEEALAGAWLAYRDRVREIFKDFSDEKLTAFYGTIDSAGAHAATFGNRDAFERGVAFQECRDREVFRRAEEVMKAGALSYCVAHDCDGALCADKHD